VTRPLFAARGIAWWTARPAPIIVPTIGPWSFTDVNPPVGARTKDNAPPSSRVGETAPTVAPRHVPVQLVIRDAATADPDARAVWAELQAERLAGMTIFATALRDRGHLRSDLTIDHARDTLWTYNSAELYQLLVIERGWSPHRYGQWIAAALTAALL